MESVARQFYENLVKSGKDIGKNYLKVTSQLVPLRVACAGGRVPLDNTSGTEPDDEAPDGDVPKKRKKVQKFSDFVFYEQAQGFDYRTGVGPHEGSNGQVLGLFAVHINAQVASRRATQAWISIPHVVG